MPSATMAGGLARGLCQRHGHNPHDYLRDVLARLPAMTTADDLCPLLPSQWQPATPTS
jgi:hypothetical protein